MNASGDFLVSPPPRTLFGQRVCDLGWNAVLGFAEGLVSLRGNRTTLAFLDGRTVLRQIGDIAYRDQLSRRLLLPAGGAAFGFLASMLYGKPAPVRFSAGTFVSALLTFLERPCRVGIAGEDMHRIEALRDHFARHAPWHEVAAIVPDREISQRFDIVIVDAPSLAGERRIERRLASVRAGLVIMAGSGLSGLVAGRPAAKVASTDMSSPTPSFA